MIKPVAVVRQQRAFRQQRHTVPRLLAFWAGCNVLTAHSAEPSDFLSNTTEGLSSPEESLWRLHPGPSDGSETLAAELNSRTLHAVLARADTGTDAPVLVLPMPDGTFARLGIEPAFDPERKPSVREYRGMPIGGGPVAARIEWTVRGLHAVVQSSTGPVYIDPVPSAKKEQYISYMAADANRPLLNAPRLPLAAVRQVESVMAEKLKRTPAQLKVGSSLLDARRMLKGQQIAPGVTYDKLPIEFEPKDDPSKLPDEARQAPGLRQFTSRDLVLVDIEAAVTPALLDHIGSLGGTIVDSLPHYYAIRARLPLDVVETLAERNDVRRIHAADRAVRDAGPTKPRLTPDAIAAVQAANAVRSQGERAHDVVTARALYNVDGTGIGIGVLSNGIGYLSERQASGDLPQWVITLPGQAGDRYHREGTAMLEIVHDLAPGAHLYFATAYGGQARFASNIEALCRAGADLIVDDVAYLHEAVFQDDIVAKAVNAVSEDGCFVFSSAGNGGNFTHETAGVWEGDFAPAEHSPLPDERGVAHDFGDGDVGNQVRGAAHTFLLKWADPLNGSANDYDLYLLDESLVDVLRSSTDSQAGNGRPVESISAYLSDVNAQLVVVRQSGKGRYFRLNAFRGKLEHATVGQTFGHSAALRAIGVAATDAQATSSQDGVFSGKESVQPFSSDGPRRVFFEPDGTPITAGNFSSTGGELLDKPDITAADNVSTTTPGFLRFVGTSAAAPHAAAIGALMLEAAGGPRRVHLERLRGALAKGALDIEAEGFDRDSGAGIPLAPTAIANLISDDRGEPPSGTLDEAIVLHLDESFNIDLATTFIDPDGADLTFTVLEANTEVANITLSGSILRVVSVAPGTVSVFVRATDPDGLSVVRRIIFEVIRDYGETDYDTDDDGLIEVATLEQLDALRYDLNGDGKTETPSDWLHYFDAFPDAQRAMGCPNNCRGFELERNLDFDDPESYASRTVNKGWSKAEGGAGWNPVGDYRDERIFRAVFNGNRHRIANLYSNRPDSFGVGLFSVASAPIANVRLVDVDVTGYVKVGGLVGLAPNLPISEASPAITANMVSGSVTGTHEVGGLAGSTSVPVSRSYSAARVVGKSIVGGLIGKQDDSLRHSFATGPVSGSLGGIGGLVGTGQNIVASYATGRVRGLGSRPARCGSYGGVGGLAGSICRFPLFASYATGRVTGSRSVGGLVGGLVQQPRLGSNYWDIETSGVAVGIGVDDLNADGTLATGETPSPGVRGKVTTELSGPTTYDGIYAGWNRDLVLNPGPHDPWDFGDEIEYPALKADWNGDGIATWEEFGYQIRKRPELTRSSTRGRVELTWSGTDTSPWKPAPAIGYSVYRNDELIAEDIRENRFLDTPPVDGTTRYTYQVSVVVLGGEAVRSNIVEVSNQPPLPPPVASRSAYGGEEFRYRFPRALDPDGDAVTYSATGLPAWLAFTPSTQTFAGLPPDSGDTNDIVVVATDTGTPPLSSTASFRLTVNPRKSDNSAPEPVGTLADIRGETGAVFTVDLGAAFRDPDGDVLDFAAVTNDDTIAAATALERAVEVRALSLGETQVTVEASDGALTAGHTFSVSVLNAAPIAGDTLPNREMTFPGDPLSISVLGAFLDADGDALTYVVTSSAQEVVAVAVSGSTVTLTPQDTGAVDIAVTAIDTHGSNRTSMQSFAVIVKRDYDADDDRLIEIDRLAQLDAIRFDHDGDGEVDIPTFPLFRTNADPTAVAAYEAAFPAAAANMGCQHVDGCNGYELMADLNFDTNNSGSSDEGDAYWNEGRGWVPIGQPKSLLVEELFQTTFEGNGHVIANLFIDRRDEEGVGLFGRTFAPTFGLDTIEIRNVTLVAVDIVGCRRTGGLVGDNGVIVAGSRVSGEVSTDDREQCRHVGGLAGHNRQWSIIRDSHSDAQVSSTANVGGLVGMNEGTILRSSASGPVTAWDQAAGGLVGNQKVVEIGTSVATGSVTAMRTAGGLLGVGYQARVHTSAATGYVEATDSAGGLVGLAIRGEVTRSFASGEVVASGAAGGLVGHAGGHVAASYATGRVAVTGARGQAGGLAGQVAEEGLIRQSYATGKAVATDADSTVGGLVGKTFPFRTRPDAIRDSYWDTDTSGWLVGVGSDDRDSSGRIDRAERATSGVTGLTTAELQAPRAYEGIYAAWSDVASDYWHFGSSEQYPALKADMDSDGTASWPEFGYQLREGPRLAATLEGNRASLIWTGVDTSHWDPPPAVRYRIYRDGNPLDAENTDTTYGDHSPGVDYQVAAMAGDAEGARSRIVRVIEACHIGSNWRAGQKCRIEFTSATFNVREDGSACVFSTCSSEQSFSVSIWFGHINVRVRAERFEEGSWKINHLIPRGPNRSPKPVGVPRTLSMMEDDIETLDVGPLFVDPDGDDLAYEVASSSAPEVAAGEISGRTLRVSSGQSGLAGIRIIAKDSHGLTAEQNIDVEVSLPRSWLRGWRVILEPNSDGVPQGRRL